MIKKIFFSALFTTSTSLLFLGNAQAETAEASFDKRLAQIKSSHDSKWVISPMRPNYIMPISVMDDPNQAPIEDPENSDREFDDVEMKFQISFMFSAIEDILFDNADLYFAYTQVSYWQAYNQDNSELFRDTNYEPETFLMFENGREYWGWKNPVNSIGFVHQSNGRGSDVISRSWNRVYVNMIFEKNNWLVGLKPWLRVSNDEENTNIDRYLGYGQGTIAYKNGDHTYSALIRNNMRVEGNRGAVELAWTFPLTGKFRGILQYFNGYGDSLLDYDYHINRVGIGFMLSDIL